MEQAGAAQGCVMLKITGITSSPCPAYHISGEEIPRNTKMKGAALYEHRRRRQQEGKNNKDRNNDPAYDNGIYSRRAGRSFFSFKA